MTDFSDSELQKQIVELKDYWLETEEFFKRIEFFTVQYAKASANESAMLEGS